MRRTVERTVVGAWLFSCFIVLLLVIASGLPISNWLFAVGYSGLFIEALLLFIFYIHKL